ncbi:MAG: hypothetical protein M3281_05175 [Chloroflexota bacterium]|nr:hypothetical protein [Chloroflexota bacterium]
MTSGLVVALRTLEIEGEVSLAGRWVKLHGEKCDVYVVEASDHRGYYTWCDDPAERAVESYGDPVEAIQAGLRRASLRKIEGRGQDG